MPTNKQFTMTEHVRTVMESTLSLIDEAASATGVFCSENLSEITRLELFQFVAYLCASDEIIQQEETDFLNQIFEEDWQPNDLADYLNNNAIRVGGFEEIVPFTLETLIKVDAALSNQKQDWRGNMCELFISLYELLGEVFIETVPHTEEWEKFDLLTYTSFLKSFVYKNSPSFRPSSEGYKKDTIADFTSQSDDFIISAKKEDLGIIAPKKS